MHELSIKNPQNLSKNSKIFLINVLWLQSIILILLLVIYINKRRVFQQYHKFQLKVMQAWRSIDNQSLFFFRKENDRTSVSTNGSQSPRNQTSKLNFKIKKEKVQLCKKFMERGYCPYNSRCKFAHGSHQLRINCDQHNSRYKTKKCTTFFKDGCCHYGNRCNFLHINTENGIQIQAKRKIMKSNFPQLLLQVNNTSRLLNILYAEVSQ